MLALSLPDALSPVLLFAAAGGLSLSIGAALVARGARRPRRATTGWALAHGLAPDPGAVGLAFGQCGTAEWPAWRIEGSGGTGAPTLILLHGWGRSRIDSLRRLAPLLPFVHAAILPDFPGHGDSQSKTSVGAREHRGLATEIRRWLQADRPGDRGSGRLLLAGHSLGGAVAIRAAPLLDQLATVVGVIAWAPYETVQQPIDARLATQGIRLPSLTHMASQLLRWRTGPEPSTIESLRAVAERSIPMVIVGSAADRIIPLHVVERVASAAPPSPRSTYAQLLVAHCSHADLGTDIDATRGAVAQRCADWCANSVRE